MDTPEQFSLKWHKFEENLRASLSCDDKFVDVTLACEDDVQIKAHKIILASGSHFFQSILSKLNHPHPLIYMKGVNQNHLNHLVEFLYKGEVSINQDDLSEFLIVAEEFEVKGLINTEKRIEEIIETDHLIKTSTRDKKQTIKTEKPTHDEQEVVKSENELKLDDTDLNIKTSQNSLDQTNTTDKTVDLERKLDSLIKKVDGVWSCSVCGKTNKKINKLKRHVEIHLEGVVHSCPDCGREFRTTNALQHHKPICFQNSIVD